MAFRLFQETQSRKEEKELELERDASGRKILTEDYIQRLCIKNGQYNNPQLNNTLYLHYKGFSKI